MNTARFLSMFGHFTTLCIKGLKLEEGDLSSILICDNLSRFSLDLFSLSGLHYFCMSSVNFTIYKMRVTFRIWAICYHIMLDHAVQCTVNKFLLHSFCRICNKEKKSIMFLILFITSIITSFKLSLTTLLISTISISVELDSDKWMEMDWVMTTNLTLTLSGGWNVSCNVGAVTQTVTLFDYSFFKYIHGLCWRGKKMSNVKTISDIYLQFQCNFPIFNRYCKLIIHTESARFALSSSTKMYIKK